jgi:phage gp29-like protein
MATVKSSILGPDGEPYERALLERDISPTLAIAGRPPFPGHLAFGIDPTQMGGIIRAADMGNTLQWMILAEEIEELYAHYGAVLAKRKRQLSQLPIKVEAADDSSEAKRHAEFVQEWIDDDMLAGAIYDVADGIGKGWSIHEIIWESKPGSVRPAELLYRPQRFFEVSWEDGETIWLREGGGFAELAPHKFLLHQHKSKSGQAVRGGLTRSVAFLWMYHAFNLKDWALFCQAYGMPIRVGRYGPDASRQDKSVLLKAVSSIAGNVAGIIPKSMEIEFVKDGDRAAGAQLFEKRADWLDRTVSKLVLGGTAGTDAIHGGHAVGQEHRAAEQDVERFDARLVGVSITRRLVQPMIAFTFGPQPKYPRVVIGQEEKAPLKDLIAAVADLGGLGLKVKASELYDRLDLTPPEDGDEIVGGLPPAPAVKPDIPSLAVTPPEAQSALFGPLSALILRHSAVPDALIEAMSERLARDAAGALGGLTDAVRAQFEAASDMQDLAHRLHRLRLPQKEYAEAMARGMALAQMVGQASVVAELHRR